MSVPECSSSSGRNPRIMFLMVNSSSSQVTVTAIIFKWLVVLNRSVVADSLLLFFLKYSLMSCFLETYFSDMRVFIAFALKSLNSGLIDAIKFLKAGSSTIVNGWLLLKTNSTSNCSERSLSN